MRFFKVMTHTNDRGEDIILSEYFKINDKQVDQFLKDTLELDMYDQKVTLKECQIAKDRWECPVGDFVVVEYFNEKEFDKMNEYRSPAPKK
ncbi:hypothetical protein [Exiguobacterium aurantiacum]|uniref:Uncharacterized protein n=1 Tax=Exiguobacterium aurantiacum TaxID=33987 RepID=A0ABY5FJ53_9BACL|nr:hypothetical protein [Exiguobacterium aurantiacum]UTT41571.1 hypothetical protein NMQ00_08315 [Exiguobacterium aurantiacum]